MENIVSLLAYNVQRIRQEQKLSQHQLADKCDVAQSHISRIESGDRNTSIVMVGKLADALQVEEYQLLLPIIFEK